MWCRLIVMVCATPIHPSCRSGVCLTEHANQLFRCVSVCGRFHCVHQSPAPSLLPSLVPRNWTFLCALFAVLGEQVRSETGRALPWSVFQGGVKRQQLLSLPEFAICFDNCFPRYWGAAGNPRGLAEPKCTFVCRCPRLSLP